MKRLPAFLLVLILLCCTALTAKAQEGPYVYKSSVRINTYHHLVYWPNPNAKEPQYNTGSWTPKVEFNVQGPLDAGSQITVTFTKPTGAVWYSVNLETPEIPADEFASFKYDDTSTEKKALPVGGKFGLTVTLSNALAGTKKVLYTAKFDVVKFPYAFGSTKGADFYVDRDWNIPIGQMVVDTQSNEQTPRMLVHMWFRGKKDQTKIAAYVFKDGKQIASTKKMGSVSETVTLEPGTTQADYTWSRWSFYLTTVAFTRTDEDNTNVSYPDIFFLDKNPGEYEIKVLYDGKLARSAKFTIGADGKLVDNGLATQNKMGKGVILIPIKVEPGVDGKAVFTNYKAQAFYGNPVVGFP